ncbi:MAG: OadG family transporter subunit [Halanaerobiales bacterium]
MTARVLFISLAGILVVFGFLFFLFLILSSFKYFFYENDDVEKKKKVRSQSEISDEELAVVLTVVREHFKKEIPGDKIMIKKRR